MKLSGWPSWAGCFGASHEAIMLDLRQRRESDAVLDDKESVHNAVPTERMWKTDSDMLLMLGQGEERLVLEQAAAHQLENNLNPKCLSKEPQPTKLEILRNRGKPEGLRLPPRRSMRQSNAQKEGSDSFRLHGRPSVTNTRCTERGNRSITLDWWMWILFEGNYHGAPQYKMRI